MTMTTTNANNPTVRIEGENLVVDFDRFDLASYELFLRVKRLPEYKLDFLSSGETYRVSAPARFAPLLGVAVPAIERSGIPVADYLFDDQREIVTTSLAAKRFACWSDCGLGKTGIGLEFARHVTHRTGGRVLIVTLNEIVPQWIEEAKKFYGDALPIVRLNSREEMKRWCATGNAKGADDDQGQMASGPAVVVDRSQHAGGSGGEGEQHAHVRVPHEEQGGSGHELPVAPNHEDHAPRASIAVVNYEKFNHRTEADQVVSEIRHLAGIVLDESSRLKTGGGKQKWSLIKSAKGVEYKLSLTATPAPNEIMEFASQASFLEKMRSDNEIIWTYFRRDEKTHRWTVKQHARKAFFEFMAGWSIYVRDPRRYGWRMNGERPPEPDYIKHTIAMTDEQRQLVMDVNADPKNSSEANAGSMFVGDLNAIAANKLSQAAKGFLYVKGKTRTAKPVDSRKPKYVAELIAGEAANGAGRGLQTLVWTVFDEESQILARLLHNSPFSVEVLTGATKDPERLAILERFRNGETRVLISRAAMLGWGMNFQHCGSMVFSGWTFSYEQFYQAVRRAYRHGQTRRVRVHVPVIPEFEGQMWDAIGRKQKQHEESIAEQEANYIAARDALSSGKERACA